MKYSILVIFVSLGFLMSCKISDNKHLIVDKDFRKQVHSQFLIQKELAKGRDSVLFSVFNQQLTIAETEGLEFLDRKSVV